MSVTTVGNHLIHYEALGRGEPLIFVHGWLGSWRYWWPAMQELSRQHRTFAFDLWGFGDSSKASNKYTLEAYVEMVGEFIDKLGIMQPVTLVGHSLGAAVAMRYATQNPHNVKRVVGVSLPVQGELINDRLTDVDADTFLTKVLGKSQVFPEVERETRKTDQAAMNALASQLISQNFENDLAVCDCPALLIFGSQDMVVQQPTVDLPETANGRHYVMLEGNHFLMLEQTAKFNRLLMDFIQGQEIIAPKEHWQRRTR